MSTVTAQVLTSKRGQKLAMGQHEVSQWSGYARKPKTSSSCDQRLGAANGYLIVTLAVKLQSNQCFHRIGHPYNGLNSALVPGRGFRDNSPQEDHSCGKSASRWPSSSECLH